VKAIRDASDRYSDEFLAGHISWKTTDGRAASSDCIQAAKFARPPEQRTSPDGTLEIVHSQDDILEIIDTKTKAVKSSLQGHQNVIHGAQFDRLGTQIASFSSGDHTVRVWSGDKAGHFSLRWVFPQVGAKGTAFSPDCNLLATSTYDDNSVGIWDLRDGRLLSRIIGNFGFAQRSSCGFNARGRLITAFSNVQLRNADRTVGNTTYSQPIPDDRFIEVWETQPVTIEADLIRIWVEVYTGTKWAPVMPGGVEGLTESEWYERRKLLGSTLEAKIGGLQKGKTK